MKASLNLKTCLYPSFSVEEREEKIGVAIDKSYSKTYVIIWRVSTTLIKELCCFFAASFQTVHFIIDALTSVNRRECSSHPFRSGLGDKA